MKKNAAPSGIFKIASVVALIATLLAVGYVIVYDPTDFRDEPYGAGDYYYTDVEGFGEIFLGENASIGTEHPVIFAVLFIGWGAICWYFLKKIEKKRKEDSTP